MVSYSKIKSNTISVVDQGMLIHVDHSASPLFYPMESAPNISGFKIRGEFRGLPVLSDRSKQGHKNFDDYPLRVGFVVRGEKKLSGLKKFFAPSWIKGLYSQIPTGFGLDHVQFYNFTQNENQVGQSRIHPSSELIKEDFISFVKASGPFSLIHKFSVPLQVIALWISIDGDDTHSKFEVLISSLELNP